jgi:betaine-aldehyde dehydrogenase
MSETAGAAPFEHPDKFFIGGEWVAPSSGATIDVIDSDTEEVFVTVAEAQAADVERAVAAARRAFDSGPWPRMSHAERAGYLRALAREMEARAEDIARVWTIESGMLHRTTQASIPGLVSAYEFYAGLAESFPFVEQHSPGGGGNVGLLVREPVGVVAAIVP